MKNIMNLPVGTKLIVTEVGSDDGWFDLSESIIGHEFVMSENGRYRYINIPESIKSDFDNNEGYYFYSVKYKILES